MFIVSFLAIDATDTDISASRDTAQNDVVLTETAGTVYQILNSPQERQEHLNFQTDTNAATSSKSTQSYHLTPNSQQQNTFIIEVIDESVEPSQPLSQLNIRDLRTYETGEDETPTKNSSNTNIAASADNNSAELNFDTTMSTMSLGTITFSESSKTQILTDNIDNILFTPLTFHEESESNKVNRILSWLLPKSEYARITNGELLRNVAMYLEKMKFHGYLRIFEVEHEGLKPYMTDTSWKLFLDFKNQRESDLWICPLCNKICDHVENRWKCMRCLFFFHVDCRKPFKEQERFCFDCVFAVN